MASAASRSPHAAILGLRAHKGGAVAVCVAMERGRPRVVLSTVLATGVEGDPLSLAPYRIAAAMPRGPEGGASIDALAAVAEGRRRQDEEATKNLRILSKALDEAGYPAAAVVLLVNRAGWITDLLGYSLAWAEHVPVAEALAVREACRVAAARCGFALVEQDEKSLPELAATALGLSPSDLASELKALAASRWKPWRKEQKLACLAAWWLATR